MEEILHQLIDSLSVYPIIYKVSYLSGGDRRISEPSTVPGWWFFATHLTKYACQIGSFPSVWGENKKTFETFWNHHLGIMATLRSPAKS